MKKVIYLPRKKGEKQFNIVLEQTGSYLDFPVAFYNETSGKVGITSPFQIEEGTTDGRLGGGILNVANITTETVNNNTVTTMKYALEVFPVYLNLSYALNVWNTSEGYVQSVKYTGLVTSVSETVNYQSNFRDTTQYYPLLGFCGMQNVIFSFNNAYVFNAESQNLEAQNVAIIVDANHFNTRTRFFTDGRFGNTTYGSRGNKQCNYSDWFNLYNIVDNALMNLSNNSLGWNMMYIMGTSARATFAKCISNQNYTIGQIKYNMMNSDDTLEGVGYNASQFNQVITV